VSSCFIWSQSFPSSDGVEPYDGLELDWVGATECDVEELLVKLELAEFSRPPPNVVGVTWIESIEDT
jgi:hypothetical protein